MSEIESSENDNNYGLEDAKDYSDVREELFGPEDREIREYFDKNKSIRKLASQYFDDDLEKAWEFIEDYDKLLIETDEGKVINQTSTTYAGHNFVMNKNTVDLDDVLGGKNQRVNPIETFQTNISRSNLNVVKRKTFNQTVMMNTLFREDYTSTMSTDFTTTNIF